MQEITWQEFQQVELRVGTIVDAQEFPQARKPAYQLKVDFGGDIGIKKSSAQITENYRIDELIGMQVVGVVNFPAKQIGPMISECLITGFHKEDGSVILATPQQIVPNGAKLA